jgi:hypothetical protein
MDVSDSDLVRLARATQTSDGHDMDHYADDLAALTAPRGRSQS